MAKAKKTEAERQATILERKGLSKVEVLRKRQAELEAKIKEAEIEEQEKTKTRPVRKACTQLQRAKAALAEAESLLIDGDRGEEAKEIYNIRTNHLADILEGLENSLKA